MPAPADSGARGLTAAELSVAIAELKALEGARVIDAVALTGTDGHDDLLVVLEPRAREGEKTFLHVALGGARARVCTTARRWGREQRTRSPGPDLLQRDLQDARLQAIEQPKFDERRFSLTFEAPAGIRRVVVELFGARGLWVLCDERGACVAMSRVVETSVRTLRRGDVYAAPPPTPPRGDRAQAPPRFASPALASIDEHFTCLDLDKERQRDEATLQLAAARAKKKAKNKVDGLQRQLEDVGRAGELRERADMMLAYAHNVARGATSMVCTAADGQGEVTLPLDPKKSVPEQANDLYDKARRLEGGREVTARRLAAATEELRRLEETLALLEAPAETDLDTARQTLVELGSLPKPQATPKPGQRSRDTSTPYRRFTSAEGYPIFVGRNNNQNDELTMRFANGNDLWLHVGGGRPGSHVVVRLPKHKTASLETLLDAGTLAVHFSKARGEPRIDVIYTLRKNVRKPKGLPPGAVVPSHTKTVTVATEELRLRRLLDSASHRD